MVDSELSSAKRVHKFRAKTQLKVSSIKSELNATQIVLNSLRNS